MKRAFPILVLAALLFCSCTDNSVEYSAGDVKVRLTAYSSDILRIEKCSAGENFSQDAGLSVVMRPQKNALLRRVKTDSSLLAYTDGLEVEISLGDASVRIMRKGETLVSEGAYAPLSQSFAVAADESLYGLGQHRERPLDVRMEDIVLKNENMEIAIPLVHSAKGYAIFWNNPSITRFAGDREGICFSSEAGTEVDYFVISGADADGVIAGIRELSGQVPMFPLWTYGFHQSKERYVSQDELLDVLGKYRELQVPLDGIVQDWQYWGEDNHNWNALKFENPRFYDPRAMLEEIHERHAHCMISVWPSFGPWTSVYKELEAVGAIMPHSTFPQNGDARNYDPFNARARQIYWDHMRDNLYDLGIDAWWLDATEPEIGPEAPSDLDWLTSAGPFRKVRNLYPLPTVKGIYESQTAYDPSRRPFILTRSAALGVQRYAHCWSGDVESSWEVLAYQIPEALNFSLCGLPYWNSDLGGFFSWKNYPEGHDNPAFRELYVRWAQFGVFTGMMRSHGTNTPREIYQFGEPGEVHFEAVRKAIELRYQLLPYIYGTAWKIHSSSATLMRALMMDWPEDGLACKTEDEFLFGPSILVAPVVEPSFVRKVYLPEGTWFDWWTGERIEGGRNITADAPIDRIPLYAKAGAIVPLGPDVQYASEKPWDNLVIKLFRGADGEFVLYEDEGEGNGYLNGKRSIIRFSWNDAESMLTIAGREGNYAGMLEERDFIVSCGAISRNVHYTGKETTIKL